MALSVLCGSSKYKSNYTNVKHIFFFSFLVLLLLVSLLCLRVAVFSHWNCEITLLLLLKKIKRKSFQFYAQTRIKCIIVIHLIRYMNEFSTIHLAIPTHYMPKQCCNRILVLCIPDNCHDCHKRRWCTFFLQVGILLFTENAKGTAFIHSPNMPSPKSYQKEFV